MCSTALLAVGVEESRKKPSRRGKQLCACTYVCVKQGESVLWPWAAGRDRPLWSNVPAGQRQEPWAPGKDRAPGTASVLAL